MTVYGKGFGEEVGWVEEGADVWEDKHASVGRRDPGANPSEGP